jgi:hypothetical protein
MKCENWTIQNMFQNIRISRVFYHMYIRYNRHDLERKIVVHYRKKWAFKY